MPFTVSHAAAAWPIRRVIPSLPFSALVIGSLSPDFEYWFRLAPSGRLAHTFVGVWVFAVPVAMIVWVAFRQAVRPALLDLLPPAAAAAVPPAERGTFAGLTGCVVGAWSHVAWDGVTHAADWGVRHVPALRVDVIPGLPWFHLLQHLSTVTGLVWIVWMTARWVSIQPRAARQFDPAARTAATVGLSVVTVPGVVFGLLNGWRGYAAGEPSLVVGFIAVGAMMGVSLGLAGLTVVHRVRIRRRG